MPMWGSMPFFSKKTLIAVWWASLVGEVEGTGAAAGSADLPAQPVNEDKRFDPTKPFKIRFPRAKGIMVTEMQGSDNLQAMFDKEATSRQAQGAQDSGAAAAQALVDLAEQIESQTMEMVLVHHDAAEGQEHEVPGGVRHEVPNADRNIYWCGKIIFSHKIKMFDTIATAEHEEAASQKCLKMSEPREGDSGDKRRDLLLVPDNGACSDLCIGGIADRPSLRSQWEIATPNGNILERNADRRVLVADKDKFDTLKDTDLMNPDSVAGLRSNAGDLRPAIQLTKRPHAAENGWPRNLEILQERPTSGGDGGTIWIGTTSPAHQGANQMYFAAPAVSAPEEPARARGDPEPGGAGGAGGGPADPVLPGLVAPPQAAAAAAAETAAPAAAPPAGPGSPPPAAPPRPRTRAVLSDQPVSVAIDINDPSHPLHPHYQSPAAKRGAAPALPDTGGVEDPAPPPRPPPAKPPPPKQKAPAASQPPAQLAGAAEPDGAPAPALTMPRPPPPPPPQGQQQRQPQPRPPGGAVELVALGLQTIQEGEEEEEEGEEDGPGGGDPAPLQGQDGPGGWLRWPQWLRLPRWRQPQEPQSESQPPPQPPQPLQPVQPVQPLQQQEQQQQQQGQLQPPQQQPLQQQQPAQPQPRPPVGGAVGAVAQVEGPLPRPQRRLRPPKQFSVDGALHSLIKFGSQDTTAEKLTEVVKAYCDQYKGLDKLVKTLPEDWPEADNEQGAPAPNPDEDVRCDLFSGYFHVGTLSGGKSVAGTNKVRALKLYTEDTRPARAPEAAEAVILAPGWEVIVATPSVVVNQNSGSGSESWEWFSLVFLNYAPNDLNTVRSQILNEKFSITNPMAQPLLVPTRDITFETVLVKPPPAATTEAAPTEPPPAATAQSTAAAAAEPAATQPSAPSQTRDAVPFSTGTQYFGD